MSSDNPRSALDPSEPKKKKTKRACDVCRRKKIGCDGPQHEGMSCSNCLTNPSDCVYTEAEKRPSGKSYVVQLESRLDNMEKLLKRLCPNVDREPTDLGTWSIDGRQAESSSSLVCQGQKAPTAFDSITPPSVEPKLFTVVNEEDSNFESMTYIMKQIRLESDQRSFFGRSSNIMLVKTAMDLKQEYLGVSVPSDLTINRKRPEFWSVAPWELVTFASSEPSPGYTFPDADLMSDLFDIYFTEPNCIMPLLHRPTFLRAVADGLHLRDSSFGAVVLLVCAIASRYSNDPRVFIEDENCTRTSGWKWFEQVRVLKKNLLLPPTLYDVQYCCLSVIFLYGSSSPQSAWSMIGIGVRFAQEFGAHRRKPKSHIHTVEDELWKRAFWVLLAMDVSVSSSLGRPCAIQEEDYDLDFPMECDDEYWQHPDPDRAFKQPPGRPSVIGAFNLSLKLNKILAYALRTIYAIQRPKNVGENYEENVVAELDSALNQWMDSVPDHLRWDPNREDYIFLRQSAMLYVGYYHLQILVHRPFISANRNPTPQSFPSLAIITNAARSCAHIIQKVCDRGIMPYPPVQLALFTSAVVLLFHIFAGKRSGLSVDINRGMNDVHECMKVLKSFESRWHSAGRCYDILLELAYIGELPLPQYSPPNHKRDRDGFDSPVEESRPHLPTPESEDEPRPIAGSRRVAASQYAHPLSKMQVPLQNNITSSFMLPMNTEELGRSPYCQSDYSYAYSAPDTIPVNDSGSVDDPSGSLPVHGEGTFQPDDPYALPFMDDVFYDQMAMIFSTPFGETDMASFLSSNDFNAQPATHGAPELVYQ